MTIESFQGDILAKTCDLLVISVFQDVKRLDGVAATVDESLDGALADAIESKAFSGKAGERLTFTTLGKMKARHVAILGLGKRGEINVDALRKLGATIVRLARERKAANVFTILHGQGADDLDARNISQALTEGLLLGAYRFHSYKGAQHKKNSQPREVAKLLIVDPNAKAVKLAGEGIERGRILAEATCLARDLVNTPSSDMTPQRMVEEAQKLATRGSGISCKVLDQKAMERMGMRATLAVARGSMHAPIGIHLSYRSAGAKKNIAVVGKAVTFDSGGLSLKPAEHMMTMKIDMAGAASVIGLFKALAVLKPRVNVQGIFLAVENMPSGSAYRPGDVVAAMDGTTIEVLNTDAEGRLTLADALSYAVKQNPDMIIDLATLTGACVIALGEDMAAVLSNDARLANKLLVSASETGEPLWELPLYAPYAEHIKSKIADIKNIGGHGGGTITAALFLKTFVGDTPWAHLDIAGPSYTERESRPDQPYGASGYGVRLLVKFLQSIAK